MATLEDKILGERRENYCSSSEESDHENSDEDKSAKKQSTVEEESKALPDINKWEGTSTNTGPKGVITDWQKYRQLEKERLAESERKKVELAKQFTMAVESSLTGQKVKENAFSENPEFGEVMDKEFMENYRKKRMHELMQKTHPVLTFGELIHLKHGQDFLNAIEPEHKSVTIIVHIYDEHIEACRTMNTSLSVLSKVYKNVKFCCIEARHAGVSTHFKSAGLPALLVYKSGSLVGNFIRVTDELGDFFVHEDVQMYLVEHGHLEDKSLTPELIKGSTNDSDSD